MGVFPEAMAGSATGQVTMSVVNENTGREVPVTRNTDTCPNCNPFYSPKSIRSTVEAEVVE